jgi:hypothetical protein
VKITSFCLDEKTRELLDKMDSEGFSKSKVIRRALQFYSEFYFDEETWELLDRLSWETKLPRKAVLVEGLKMLEEVLKLGR